MKYLIYHILKQFQLEVALAVVGASRFFFSAKSGKKKKKKAKLLWIHQEIALPGRDAWAEESQLCLVTSASSAPSAPPVSPQARLAVNSACSAGSGDPASLLSTTGCSLSPHVKILWPLAFREKRKKKKSCALSKTKTSNLHIHMAGSCENSKTQAFLAKSFSKIDARSSGSFRPSRGSLAPLKFPPRKWAN